MLTIIEELPWTYALNSGALRKHCHFCFKRATDCIMCLGCRFASYCSPNCMLKALGEHKDECQFLRAARGTIPNERIRLLSRIIMKLRRNEGHRNPRININLEDLVQRSYFDLESREKEIAADKERMNEYRTTREQLEVYMANSTLPEAKELFQIYCRMIMNVFTITGNTMLPVGIGIYLALTQVKHSCCPNSVIVYSGLTARLNYLGPQTGKKMELGEFSVSYLPLIGARDERRKALKKRYYFDCNCSKCMDDQQSALETEHTCRAGTSGRHEFINGSYGDDEWEISNETSCPVDSMTNTSDNFGKIKREVRGGKGPFASRLNRIYDAARKYLGKRQPALTSRGFRLVGGERVVAGAACFAEAYKEAVMLYEKTTWRTDENILQGAAVRHLHLVEKDSAHSNMRIVNAYQFGTVRYEGEEALDNVDTTFSEDSEQRTIEKEHVLYGIECQVPLQPAKMVKQKPVCTLNPLTGKR